MAITISATQFSYFSACDSFSVSTKQSPRSFPKPPNSLNLKPLKSPHSSFRVLAAPEILELPVSPAQEIGDSVTSELSPLTIGTDSSKVAPKQKIRIKLRCYYVHLIEDASKQIMEAARRTNAKTMGPVPLPTRRHVFSVLKSPFVHKDARDHFEIRTHIRLIDILYPTAQTIDSLMQLDLPAGVDVEVKL